MKKQIKALIIMILVILGVIMMIIAFAMSTVVNKDAVLEKNSEVILDNYTKLTNDSGVNTDLRKELSDKLKTFSPETYESEHNDYVELLTKYNKNIQKMGESATIISSKCEKKYEESRTNIICMSYNMLYETAINTYVKNLLDYNNRIDAYNKSNNGNYEKFLMVHKEYVDFDKNGVYEGKISDK